MSITLRLAEHAITDLRDASRLGNVSNEELLCRLVAALLVIHERSDDPGTRALAHYGLGEMPALLAGELPGERFPVTSKLCAVRRRNDYGTFDLSLEQDDVLALVGEVKSIENENTDRRSSAVSQIAEVPS